MNDRVHECVVSQYMSAFLTLLSNGFIFLPSSSIVPPNGPYAIIFIFLPPPSLSSSTIFIFLHHLNLHFPPPSTTYPGPPGAGIGDLFPRHSLDGRPDDGVEASESVRRREDDRSQPLPVDLARRGTDDFGAESRD